MISSIKGTSWVFQAYFGSRSSYADRILHFNRNVISNLINDWQVDLLSYLQCIISYFINVESHVWGTKNMSTLSASLCPRHCTEHWQHEGQQKQVCLHVLGAHNCEWVALNPTITETNIKLQLRYEGTLHVNMRVIIKTSEPAWETTGSFLRKSHWSQDLRLIRSEGTGRIRKLLCQRNRWSKDPLGTSGLLRDCQCGHTRKSKDGVEWGSQRGAPTTQAL